MEFEAAVWNQKYCSGKCKRDVENVSRQRVQFTNTESVKEVLAESSLEGADRLEFLRQTNIRLARENARLKVTNVEIAEMVDRAIRENVAKLKIPALKKPKPDRRKKTEEYAVAVLSDWQCVDVDSVIFTRDGGAQRIKNNPDAWSTGRRETVRLRMQGGADLILTPDHPVSTPSGWRYAGDLSSGDLVHCLGEFDVWSDDSDLDDELARLLGYMVTDGSFSSPRQSPKFTNNSIQYHAEVASIVVRRFGINSKFYQKMKGWDQLLTTDGPNALTSWLRSLEFDCKFPVDIFRSNTKVASAFLNRVFSGDGCITTRGSRKQPSIELACGTDRVYASYMQALLLKLGVRSTITTEVMKRSTKPFHRLLITPGAQNVQRFFDRVGFIYGKEEACLRASSYHDGRRSIREPDTFIDSDGEAIACRKVLSVHPAGYRDVWDMTVPGKGWFIAQGIKVHNCGKKTQDYDVATCERRIELYADKLLRIAELQRADHPVRHLRVYLLGDMVEGEDIFAGQPHHLDKSLYYQVAVDGPRIIVNFLRQMLKTFETIHVVGIAGNHGRIGGHPKENHMHPSTNADRMLYSIVQQILPDEDRLTWDIPTGELEGDFYTTDKVGSKTFLLFHGHQIRGMNGVPYASIEKKIKGWAMGAIQEKFDYAIMGHFHTPTRTTINTVTAYVNGTTESSNGYAVEVLAAVGRPCQYLLFVHPEHGISAEYVLYLDTPL